MKPSKAIYYSAASLLPTGILKKVAPAGSLLPYHHLVSDEEVLHVKHLYPYKNIRQFTDDLEHLLKHYRPVSVEELAGAVLSGKKTPSGAFLLSFGDGFREVYDIIAPILLARGVPAVFFVNPAFLDNQLLFYRCKISLLIEEVLRQRERSTVLKECAEILRDGGGGVDPSPEGLVARIRRITNLDQGLLDGLAIPLEFSFDEYLGRRRPFLSVAQVGELRDKGFTIGAHSWDHPYYDLISPEEQVRQTLESMEFVNKKFPSAHRLFSFPHSDANLPQSFFDRLFAERAPVELLFGIQNQLEEPANRLLHRFNAERPDLPMSQQLNGVLLWMLIKKWSGKYSVKRKGGT
jgi:peptidoglycan/xylan/chitin deacetylase (PgdA/CDA1 family)